MATQKKVYHQVVVTARRAVENCKSLETALKNNPYKSDDGSVLNEQWDCLVRLLWEIRYWKDDKS